MFDTGDAGVGYTEAKELGLFEMLRLNGRLAKRYQDQADAQKKAAARSKSRKRFK